MDSEWKAKIEAFMAEQEPRSLDSAISRYDCVKFAKQEVAAVKERCISAIEKLKIKEVDSVETGWIGAALNQYCDLMIAEIRKA